MKKYGPERLDKKQEYSVAELKKAIEKDEIISGKMIKTESNLDSIVRLGKNITGKISKEDFQINVEGKQIKPVSILSKVGKTVKFKVKSIQKKDEGYVAILSRREAQEECKKEFIDKLQVGQIVDAMALHIETFGIFCDIGCGIVALLPIENLCIARIIEPKKWLRGIKKIKAIVKSIDDKGNITLTHREMLGTWEEEVSKFNIEETVTGIVRNIEDYGVFIQLTPNLVGLADPYDGVNIGDCVSVFIRGFYPDKMKVKLMIISNNGPSDENERIYFDYKIPESGFVKYWKYSPDNCERLVESKFE